jgi:peptidoglycan-N-acetylglucosamine deacetylase
MHSKPNGGKGSALNYGLDHCGGDIVVTIDGDTLLRPDAVGLLVAHFVDPSVGAVAGNIVVGNENNLITAFQSLEYITSQNLDRRAFALFNAIAVVPGAVGAWRRTAVVEAGGYSSDTLAEDADLTLTLERRGWRVLVEPGAQALTEAPETLRGFMKQRFRWTFGMLQVAYKHAAPHGRGWGVSLVTIPNTFIFQFAFTLIAPVMDLSALYAVFLMLIGSGPPDTLLPVIGYWLLFQLVDGAVAAVGIALNRRGWRLLPLTFLQRFSYRQLLYVSALRALMAAVKGRFVGWGKLIRTGHVFEPAVARAPAHPRRTT